MLTRAQIKHIRSLALQKYRQAHQAYIVEGPKLVAEWLRAGAALNLLAATPEWRSENASLLAGRPDVPVAEATAQQLSEAGQVKTSQGVLAIAPMPAPGTLPEKPDGWTLVLAGVQDPGNVGAIIRIADWFGLKSVVASPDSASFYNPKVVQAAMGGHLRVELHTTDVAAFLEAHPEAPSVATVLDGANAFDFSFPETGFLVIGNESKGLDAATAALCRYPLAIPSFGGAESLNAAVATGIFCSLIRQRGRS